VAFIYDHCWPDTVGGAERYYWRLTRELAREHDVTYITQKWWKGPRVQDRDGVRTVGLNGPGKTMSGDRRAIGPTLHFGAAVAWHLLRHGRRYDVVHCANFPHFALLGARLGLLAHRDVRLYGDWHEVWRRRSWQAYLGRFAGNVGYAVQRLAVRAAHETVSFSHLHGDRLVAEGRRGAPVLLPEFLPEGPPVPNGHHPREPLVVFLGRLIPDKHVELVPDVVAALRRTDPRWRGIVFGEGPARELVAQRAEELSLNGALHLPGFAPRSQVEEALCRARVLILPSTREGFGIVVLEAAALGTPTVLVEAPDNAAVELIEDGVNGRVVDLADPERIAEAVLALAAVPDIHERTSAWWAQARRHFDPEETIRLLRAEWDRPA
jgi:glycosyltransferase involved in cell wall biosynthesis